VRRDPANWFWVHKRWKPRKNKGTTEPSVDEAATTGDTEVTEQPERRA
jgi:hypothetical protein